MLQVIPESHLPRTFFSHLRSCAAVVVAVFIPLCVVSSTAVVVAVGVAVVGALAVGYCVDCGFC